VHTGPHSHAEVTDHVPVGGSSPRGGRRNLRVGVGGPVGTGKTALIAELCRALRDRLELAVVTNDIFTTEDAEALRRQGVLADDRIVPVETGGCPHTAIRDDIAANLDAVEAFERRLPDLDVVFVESGGDNLTAIFSRALVDVQLFVVDVAGGDKVPRKGGPGVTTADLLVINKTDLAAAVGVSLMNVERDTISVRQGRPYAFTNLRQGAGVEQVCAFVIEHGMLD
jgi:urease accessory protein